MTRAQRIVVAVVATCIAALVLIISPAVTQVTKENAQPVAAVPSASPSVSPTPTKPNCGPKRPSYNYTEAKKGPGPDEKEDDESFGKSADFVGPIDAEKTDVASMELAYRLYGEPGGIGGDWRLLTAIKHAVDGTDKNMKIRDFDHWCELVADLLSRAVWSGFKLEHLKTDQTAKSMSMTRGPPGELPTVNDETMDDGVDSNFLIGTFKKQGSLATTTVLLRLRCGFQPYALV